MSTKGAFLAAAVAGLFSCASSTAAAPTPASSEKTGMATASGEPVKAVTASVHCAGINSCKGQSACMSASNSCAGKNECKGKGWVDSPSKDDCTAKGGTVVAMQ